MIYFDQFIWSLQICEVWIQKIHPKYTFTAAYYVIDNKQNLMHIYKVTNNNNAVTKLRKNSQNKNEDKQYLTRTAASPGRPLPGHLTKWPSQLDLNRTCKNDELE